MNTLYLVHHGIKGQKWGIRRFQNPDGTLTEEGKRRYADEVVGAQRQVYKEYATFEKAQERAGQLQKERDLSLTPEKWDKQHYNEIMQIAVTMNNAMARAQESSEHVRRAYILYGEKEARKLLDRAAREEASTKSDYNKAYSEYKGYNKETDKIMREEILKGRY